MQVKRIFLSLALVLAADSCLSQTDFWQPTESPFSGVIYTVASDSLHGQIFAGTEDGLYRSLDGGRSWEFTTLPRNAVSSVVVDPSGRLFAGTDNGVFASSDNGQSWTALGFRDKSIRSLAAASGDTLFAAVGDKIYRSADGGVQWKIVFSCQTPDCEIHRLMVTLDGHLFATTRLEGILRST
ncbi:MAG: hypothetical protein D6743_14580, partial [Calditrichaeota bacterium]